MKPKKGDFRIRTREGSEEVPGYVLGLWATRKGRYFWEFTHVPTGILAVTYPCIEKKAAALEHLIELHEGRAKECSQIFEGWEPLKEK